MTAQRSQESSIAIKLETTNGTWANPGVGDEIVAADLRITPQPLTQDPNEYTGTVHRPGEILVGETIEVSARFFLRGPGGTTVPAADAFIMGRALRSCGFTELLTSAAIPVAPEAVVAASATGVTLGAAAAATAGLYRGLMIDLPGDAPLRPKRFRMIRNYSAAKVAELGDPPPGSYAGNYQIPAQLGYLLSPATNIPTLSIAANAGQKRYSCAGMAPSTIRFNFPTASRDSQESPSLEITWSGKIHAVADVPAIVVNPTISIPSFRDGKFFVNRIPLGGASLSIDLNAEVAYPPNPNEVDGYETGLLTRTTRRVSMQLNQVADTIINLRTLAQGQGYVPIEAIYGVASGNAFGMLVTDARLFTPISGPFVTTQLEAVIDGADRHIALAIPFYA